MSRSTASHVADYVAQLTGKSARVVTDFCGGYEIVVEGAAVARVDAFGDIRIIAGANAIATIANEEAA